MELAREKAKVYSLIDIYILSDFCIRVQHTKCLPGSEFYNKNRFHYTYFIVFVGQLMV